MFEFAHERSLTSTIDNKLIKIIIIMLECLNNHDRYGILAKKNGLLIQQPAHTNGVYLASKPMTLMV
ncbi:hypothetical protein C9I99_15085 [Photobacterium lutimaris]|uniref:Uncharacterized protein n=1 Tax=Photobacterium lutimaris TaxID=388278 RepID=A0A2T3IWT6_9GAMM|nr:hypothetical protein C9I99_15085 [Photobacterium lutimaris]